MIGMLTDLDVAVRKSGLIINERPNWRTTKSNGGEDYRGISIHHTGGYDDIGDTSSDEAYADWMKDTGRGSELPPPLCNLALSAESVVFVCAAGNANGVGRASASGPMPAFSDGNRHYIVIEAMNSGTQGWGKKGLDADGNEITQYQGYVRLCAALCVHYGWDASVIRAHWETSVTGKWDPGDPEGINFNGQKVMDMDKFRADVARVMREMEEEDMPLNKEDKEWLRQTIRKEAAAAVEEVLAVDMNANEPNGEAAFKGRSLRNVIKAIAKATGAVK